MARVILHRYCEEARQLIESRSYDDAIAICRDILKRFPKHVETYRILGEACLEKGELDEATDIFKRLLSADPENFVAYAGLGVIHEQKQQLAQAIWHMERAFELAPNNEDIRNALRRLYCQRDGAEPVRIKLNKVALARLYSRGGQFRQAIEEFGRSLELEQGRLDIQLSLMETFWRDGRREQAAELARDILKVSPDCLKAILLLGAIQIEKGRTEEGQEILSRARALDPENRMAQALFGDRSPLPLQEVMMPRTAARITPVVPAGVSAAEGAAATEEVLSTLTPSDAEPERVAETPIAAIPEEPIVAPSGATEPMAASEPEEPAQALIAEPPAAQLTTEPVEAAPVFELTSLPEEETTGAGAPEEAEESLPAAPTVSAIATESAVFPVQTAEVAAEVTEAAAAGLPKEQTEDAIAPEPELHLQEVDEAAQHARSPAEGAAALDVVEPALQEAQSELSVLPAPETAPTQVGVRETPASAHVQKAAPAQEGPVLTRQDEGREGMAMPPMEEAEAVAPAMAPGPTTETPAEAGVVPQIEGQVHLAVPQAEATLAPEPEAGPGAPAEAPAIPPAENVSEMVVPVTTAAPKPEPGTEIPPVEVPVAAAATPAGEATQAAAPELPAAPSEKAPPETPAQDLTAATLLPVTEQSAAPVPAYPEVSFPQPEPQTVTAGREPAAETALRPASEPFVVAEPSPSVLEAAPAGSIPVAEAFAARPSVDIERHRQQLKQNPKDDLTRLSLARIYRDQEQVELALEQYRALERAKPELLSEVIVDMEGIVASRPGNLTAHELLGDLYTKNGLLRKALERYRWLLVQYDQKPA